MQVIISTRGLPVSNTYRDAMTRRLEKLRRMMPAILEARIVLSREKHRRTAAMTLVAPHRTIRSEETASDLAAAVDMAIDALERQVRAIKERVKIKKGRGARGLRRAVEPAPAAPDVTVRRVPLKPMSLAEAVEEFRDGRDFLVFVDARTDGVSVLYRRQDGGLGLIEPVACRARGHARPRSPSASWSSRGCPARARAMR
jgi:putative sigma-54 modulation protein